MSGNDEPDATDDCCVGSVSNHIYFYEEVNKQSLFRFARLFRQVGNTGPKLIIIHINSIGGEMHIGFALMDIVRLSTIETVAIVEGFAASAATLLVLGCTQRLMTRNSFMLVHQPSSMFEGTSQEWEHEDYNLKKMYKRMINVYKKRTNLSLSAIKDALCNDKYWDAKRCMAVGIIDCIASSDHVALRISEL